MVIKWAQFRSHKLLFIYFRSLFGEIANRAIAYGFTVGPVISYRSGGRLRVLANYVMHFAAPFHKQACRKAQLAYTYLILVFCIMLSTIHFWDWRDHVKSNSEWFADTNRTLNSTYSYRVAQNLLQRPFFFHFSLIIVAIFNKVILFNQYIKFDYYYNYLVYITQIVYDLVEGFLFDETIDAKIEKLETFVRQEEILCDCPVLQPIQLKCSCCVCSMLNLFFVLITALSKLLLSDNGLVPHYPYTTLEAYP